MQKMRQPKKPVEDDLGCAFFPSKYLQKFPPGNFLTYPLQRSEKVIFLKRASITTDSFPPNRENPKMATRKTKPERSSSVKLLW
jgi:hypothetical protein